MLVLPVLRCHHVDIYLVEAWRQNMHAYISDCTKCHYILKNILQSCRNFKKTFLSCTILLSSLLSLWSFKRPWGLDPSGSSPLLWKPFPRHIPLVSILISASFESNLSNYKIFLLSFSLFLANSFSTFVSNVQSSTFRKNCPSWHWNTQLYPTFSKIAKKYYVINYTNYQ